MPAEGRRQAVLPGLWGMPCALPRALWWLPQLPVCPWAELSILLPRHCHPRWASLPPPITAGLAARPRHPKAGWRPRVGRVNGAESGASPSSPSAVFYRPELLTGNVPISTIDPLVYSPVILTPLTQEPGGEGEEVAGSGHRLCPACAAGRVPEPCSTRLGAGVPGGEAEQGGRRWRRGMKPAMSPRWPPGSLQLRDTWPWAPRGSGALFSLVR